MKFDNDLYEKELKFNKKMKKYGFEKRMGICVTIDNNLVKGMYKDKKFDFDSYWICKFPLDNDLMLKFVKDTTILFDFPFKQLKDVSCIKGIINFS